MRTIRIVGDSFAVLNTAGNVIVIVSKCNDTQWHCVKVVPGIFKGVTYAVPLHHALEEAVRFTESA